MITKPEMGRGVYVDVRVLEIGVLVWTIPPHRKSGPELQPGDVGRVAEQPPSTEAVVVVRGYTNEMITLWLYAAVLKVKRLESILSSGMKMVVPMSKVYRKDGREWWFPSPRSWVWAIQYVSHVCHVFVSVCWIAGHPWEEFVDLGSHPDALHVT